MKILILCDHYPLSPRAKKIRSSIIKMYPKATVKIFAWNREGKIVKETYVEAFSQNIGYGNKAKKILNIIKFVKSLQNKVDSFKPDYIHAIDFEMLVSSKIISRNEKKVYEVYDIKFFRNKIVNWLREKIEVLIVRKEVDAMVLASPYFESYYNNKGLKQVLKITLNNKPSSILKNFKCNEYMLPYEKKLEDKIAIGFVGTIRYKEILLNLIDSTKNLNNVIILLVGNGPHLKNISDYIKSNKLENKVITTGRYEEADLPIIYNTCDYIWAAYPNKSSNVKVAISNKFFESIVFNKKVIVSENTMVGDTVKKLQIGYTVNPYDVENITNLIKMLDKNNNTYSNHITFGEGLFWENEEYKIKKIY